MSALAAKPDVEPNLPRPPLVTQNGTALVWWTLSSGLVLMQRFIGTHSVQRTSHPDVNIA
jgi:hypothetical protein